MKAKLKKKYRQHERKLATVIALSVIFTIIVIVFIRTFMIEPVGEKRLVTIYDRGNKQVVLTRAETVEKALEASRIRLNPQDVTEPSGKTILDSAAADVIVYRSRMVAVIDGAIRQNVVTVAQSPNAIVKDAKLESIGPEDKARFSKGDLTSDGPAVVLTLERVKKEIPKQAPAAPAVPAYIPLPNALTASKGAQVFVDSQGVAHRETYYDLPMNIVIRACGSVGSYTIRSDGAKVDQDGYILVAANLNSYPRCSVVETSMGPGKVYDTGGFAAKHPYGFDLATDWTNYNGQ